MCVCVCERDVCAHMYTHTHISWGFPWWLGGKELACQSRRCRFDPWVRNIPWRRKWKPTPVFLPGKRHGQRSLVGYIVHGGHKKSWTSLSN